jgi:methylmalonyl-CoA mutase
LVWESNEGISVKPFYHADDFENKNIAEIVPIPKWHIGQNIYAGNGKKANEKALAVLHRGAECLIFTIPSQEIKVDALLQNIDLAETPIYFEMQFLSFEYIKKIRDYVVDKNANIYLNIDIIGNLALTGNWFQNMDKDHEILTQILEGGFTKIGVRTLSIDVSLHQNAGANRVQQLAYAMAHANEYLIFIKNKGLKPLQEVTFKVAADSGYFLEIAKLRALRLLWKALTLKYGIDTDCHIVSTPTLRNKTLYDHHVNLLRTTTECMSAILGGANTVCNVPYDGIFHKDNEFSERLARNQLLIIKEESHFKKVSNPSDGSYFIDSLTAQIAEKALALFKNIEAGGGFLKQLKAHNIQKKIRESAQKEQNQFNKNEKVLVGSNKYLNDLDRMKDDLELFPFVKTKPRKTLLEPIVAKRLAEDFEKRRLQFE